ncbi:DNA adenine methylase [Natronorubrum aibiense]|uniref:site-specific DNA-methyltransferase (adenine-specific) n=1 Tax=Natronorubrum aibiense TaxID=348826 RepID=A0A5P9P801_9EURY|nr:Dam family site-specific DNA-(adenine-N6)-methyltransferase [Natronorubrum aibiense]QFU84289.1 Dam family site-specific DNA-(adenine-N6)-methyltransferase [Natronorubrum aibiense]
MAKPVLKWAGGKRQMLDEILPRVPSENRFDRYFEPFVGGGALFFELEPSNAYLSDVNSRLVNFYTQVQQRPEELIGVISELIRKHSEELYYERRTEFNEIPQNAKCPDLLLRQAGLFYYLNQTCFNGLYRENEEGDFNVPYGRQKTDPSVQPDQIRQAHKALQSATIKSGDFMRIEEMVTDNDLVYFDPPYQKLSGGSNFSQYNKKGYASEEQDDLRNLAVRLHKKGARVLITNSISAKSLYTANKIPDPFRVVDVTAERAINSDSAHRTVASEIIVTNISPFELTDTDTLPFLQ